MFARGTKFNEIIYISQVVPFFLITRVDFELEGPATEAVDDATGPSVTYDITMII